MSLLDIVIDEDGYGCAVMLTTAVVPEVLCRWFEVVHNVIMSTFRFHITKEFLSDACADRWYTIRFEMIHIAERNIRSVDDVYEIFFAQTILDEWLSQSDLHSDKRLRKMGSLVAGRKKVATEELLALFEVNKLIFNAKIKRDSCCQEFAEMCKVDASRVTWESLQHLSDKYGCDGGRWILTPICYDDIETMKRNINWIALQLLRSFLGGEMTKEKFIKGIIFRSDFRREMKRRKTVFCVVNTSTTFNGLRYTRNACIQDDYEVARVYQILLRIGVATHRRLLYMKYKPKICSVCHILPGCNFIHPHIYDGDIREEERRNKCGCRYRHVTVDEFPHHRDAKTVQQQQ